MQDTARLSGLLLWPDAHLGDHRGDQPRARPARVARDQLRREYGAERLAAFEASVAARRRRWVALYWESAGDELGWTDGQSSGAGQLNHWQWLDLVHRPQVHGWLVEHQVDLGSSDASGTHALVIDPETGQAWIAPMATARARSCAPSDWRTCLWTEAQLAPGQDCWGTLPPWRCPSRCATRRWQQT
jgi:hypothetical protein